MKEFISNARIANLGDREALRLDGDPKKLKKMGTAWLDRLENLCDEEEEDER